VDQGVIAIEEDGRLHLLSISRNGCDP
jgi:hypothetical protein